MHWTTAVAITCILLGGFLYTVLQYRYAKRRLAQAQAKTHWLALRDELLSMAASGTIDVRSETFRVLVRLHSIVVRDVADYAAIAQVLHYTLFGASRDVPPPWLAEKAAWPKGLTAILARMADGTEAIARSYPGASGVVARGLIRPVRKKSGQSRSRARVSPSDFRREIPSVAQAIVVEAQLAEVENRLRQLSDEPERPLALVG